MHYTSKPILALGLGALAFALAACGGDDPQVEPGDAPERSPADEEEEQEADEPTEADDGEDEDSAPTDLAIVIEIDPDADEGGSEPLEPAEWTLTCEPAGGDHPDPQAACADLADVDSEVLGPVPEDQSCTMIYGGPERAHVSGTLDGSEITAEFSRQDGCELHRWDEMGAVLEP